MVVFAQVSNIWPCGQTKLGCQDRGDLGYIELNRKYTRVARLHNVASNPGTCYTAAKDNYSMGFAEKF